MRKEWFIAAFFISLIGPTAVYPLVKNHLDQTNYENRELASFPELSLRNFENIPAEFENYYNDHVPFKNFFVRAKTKMDLKLLGDTSISAVTVGKDNWLFYTVSEPGEDALADYQKTNLYTGEQEEAIGEAVASIQSDMQKRGIRFFVFEAPNKESVYGEYMPDSIKTYGDVSRLDVLIPDLSKRGLPVFYLKDALMEYADEYQLYYKYDTHWNQLGSFIGAQQIAKVLTGESMSLQDVTIQENGKCSGDLARMLNMAAEYSNDTEYVVENYLPDITVTQTEADDKGYFAVYESDSPNDRTLLLVGDSFSQGLKYFLPSLFRKTVFATFDTYDNSLIEKYRPDDFIYMTVERNQDLFENMEEIVWREEVSTEEE